MKSEDNKEALKKIYMKEIENDLIANNFLPKVGPSQIILNRDQTAFEFAHVTVSNGYSQTFLKFLNHLALQLADARADLKTKKE
jgi:hypothetical protein